LSPWIPSGVGRCPTHLAAYQLRTPPGRCAGHIRSPAQRTDGALATLNALFIAAGIAANLGFEEIGLDLYVVAAVAILAVFLLVRQPKQLILRYYAIAFVVGLIGAGVAQLA
jgi:hypothetical protein